MSHRKMFQVTGFKLYRLPVARAFLVLGVWFLALIYLIAIPATTPLTILITGCGYKPRITIASVSAPTITHSRALRSAGISLTVCVCPRNTFCIRRNEYKADTTK